MKQLTPEQQLALMIKLAAEGHIEQFDKGGRPYVLHVLKVMHYLKEKHDDELNCIAVGHDLLEDTLMDMFTLQNLGFSVRVIDGIVRLTKVSSDSNVTYMYRILNSFDACRVKLADLRHNTDIRRLKGVREKDLKRMAKYHKMHLSISEMIKWYEENNLKNYSLPGDYFAEKDEKIEEIMNAYKGN
ncbi:RelA/SpoT family protein [Salmonella phage SSBI34]|nr:RelA/SpoT family protein [Salmonella phage SSBI34]